MNFYERYQNWETTAVYADITELGQKAFGPQYYPDVRNVLEETFSRVAYNLRVMHRALIEAGYLFKKEFQYNSDQPLLKPFPDTEALLIKLARSVKPFGYVPESLKMFYRAIGGCNFAWDYETNEDYRWVYADPIQIIALDDLVSIVSEDEYWEQDMRRYFEEDHIAFLELSADYYHKDNTSGGAPYALLITPVPAIDSSFLNEEHNTTFIDYLRVTLENCGFTRITNPECENDYQDFFSKVKPQLKKI
jgi:hypothetical protein